MAELVENNRGIVNKIANKYNGINRELELDDLFQDGVLGLIKAAEKYDFNNEKKAKFITYAVFYIDRYIQGSVNGWSSKEIRNNKFYKDCISTNTPVGEEADGREIEEIIEDIDYGFENVEEKLFLNNLRNELNKVMQKCNTLEQREVLKHRYGWNTSPMKLDDIAYIFNITREKVRSIESMALRKLRNSSWAMKNIKTFAELGYIDSFYLGVLRDWGIDV